jgi:hypothetical protein
MRMRMRVKLPCLGKKNNNKNVQAVVCCVKRQLVFADQIALGQYSMHCSTTLYAQQQTE